MGDGDKGASVMEGGGVWLEGGVGVGAPGCGTSVFAWQPASRTAIDITSAGSLGSPADSTWFIIQRKLLIALSPSFVSLIVQPSSSFWRFD